MALHGSSIPLDGGGFVTTVVCPNRYSYGKLLDFIQHLNPEAGEPPDPAATEALRERVEAQDAEDLGLKAGEAYTAAEFTGCEGTDGDDDWIASQTIQKTPAPPYTDDHAIQYSNATTPAGAQSYRPINQTDEE